MAATRKMTVEMPEAMARRIDARVASGAYADADEVVIDSLRSQLGDDAEVERWLVEEVAPTYDAYKADASRLRSEVDAFDLVAERVSAKGKAD